MINVFTSSHHHFKSRNSLNNTTYSRVQYRSTLYIHKELTIKCLQGIQFMQCVQYFITCCTVSCICIRCTVTNLITYCTVHILYIQFTATYLITCCTVSCIYSVQITYLIKCYTVSCTYSVQITYLITCCTVSCIYSVQ